MKLDPQLLEFAKTMRSNATDAENLMWRLLRAKRFMNLKFRRQHIILNANLHSYYRKFPYNCARLLRCRDFI